MNVLMTLAAVGAAAIGQWSEAGLVTFLFGLGTVLQVATLERTRRADQRPHGAHAAGVHGRARRCRRGRRREQRDAGRRGAPCAPANGRPWTASSSRGRPQPTRRGHRRGGARRETHRRPGVRRVDRRRRDAARARDAPASPTTRSPRSSISLRRRRPRAHPLRASSTASPPAIHRWSWPSRPPSPSCRRCSAPRSTPGSTGGWRCSSSAVPARS